VPETTSEVAPQLDEPEFSRESWADLDPVGPPANGSVEDLVRDRDEVSDEGKPGSSPAPGCSDPVVWFAVVSADDEPVVGDAVFGPVAASERSLAPDVVTGSNFGC